MCRAGAGRAFRAAKNVMRSNDWGSKMSDAAVHNRFIAIWRGVAVLIVAYFHFSDRIPYELLGADGPATFPNHIGKLGVYIFFVISGYLIAMSLERCNNLAEFLAKRVSRIWPLFIFASVVIFIFASTFETPVVLEGPKQFNTEERTLLDLVGSSLFLTDLGFMFMDGVFWSIIVELKFYLFIGLFAVLFGRNYVNAFCMFAIIISSVDFGILIFSGGENISFVEQGPLSPLGTVLHGILISQYLPLFALGAALFKKKFDATLGLLLLLSAVSCIIGVAEDMQFNAGDNIRFIFMLIGLLIVDHYVLKDRLFLWLGDYSYSIYLFHQLIGLTIIRAVAPTLGMDVAMAVAFAGIFAIAFVSSWLVEWRFRRPVTRFLLALFSKAGLNRLIFFPGEQAQPSSVTLPASHRPSVA